MGFSSGAEIEKAYSDYLSSITSLRTFIIATACSSVKPSSFSRWTNFNVSKWWSRSLESEAENDLELCAIKHCADGGLEAGLLREAKQFGSCCASLLVTQAIHENWRGNPLWLARRVSG